MFALTRWAAPGNRGSARRLLVAGVVAFVAVVLILAGRPAASQAFPRPTVGVSGPSEVTMPDGVLLDLGGASEAPGNVSIAVWDHNWNSLGGCLDSCAKRYLTGALEGGTHVVHETFHVEAFAPDGQNSGIVDKTVTFDPVDWQVSLDMPAEVSMPDQIPASVSVSPVTVGGPATVLIDADTLTHPFPGINCATWQGLCSGSINTGWLGAVPVTRHYRAEMMDAGTTVAADSKTVTIYPPNIGVTVWAPSFVLPGHTYTIKVTNTYNQWTPYTIEILDGNGTPIGYCTVDQATCEVTVTAGAEGSDQGFSARVTSGSTTLSTTPLVKVPATDPSNGGGGGGAGRQDDIDIATLAAAFGSASEVCDGLLLYPGTNVNGTSTSDQSNACELVAQGSNPTATQAIQAALNAMAGVGIAGGAASLLAWLQHYVWVNWGDNAPPHPTAPPANPTSPPTSTPAPVSSAADALADALKARNPALAAAGTAVALQVARACLFRTGAAGLSGGLCSRTPIFVPGATHAAATDLRIHALTHVNPGWVRLTRRIGPRDPWYESQPECADRNTLMNCDEFPENKTYQGGDPHGLKPRPYLDLVNAADNQGLGGALGNFVTGCAIPDGGAYLVIPVLPSLGIPTMSNICN